MANREQLVDKRRKELEKKGYPPGIIGMALDWAEKSSRGMARYVLNNGLLEDGDPDLEKTMLTFLPRYLKDTEKYIRAFGHTPKRG